MTITTIRPDGMAWPTNAAPTYGGGATTPYGATSDNSDLTYVQGHVDRGSARMTLQDVTVTSSQRVKSCQIRIRTAFDAAGSITQDTAAWLADNINTKLTPVGQVTVARGLTSILTSTGPLALNGPGGKPWTQASVNSLGLSLEWFKSAGAIKTVFQRVHELYVDVDINNQPTVSGAPVVTNFTNNATPTVTWVYNDVDGDPQVRYRVKLFTAAMVAAGNFDPEASPSAWDSAEQAGSGNSVTVSPLVNGTTYTAYVKVAQAWQGALGPYYWSTWVASAAFTVTYTLPYTPTITAVALTDPNACRALINADVPVNLLDANTASLESSIGSWVADINCTVARITTDGADGTSSLQMTATALGNMQAMATAGLNQLVDIGKTYTFLASFRTAVTARSCAVGVYWYDNSNTLIPGQGAGTFGSTITDTAASGFTQASLTIVAPAGAQYARIVTRVVAAAAGEVHKADKFSIHLGTSTSWMPGGYTNDQGDLLLERGERVDDSRGTAENWAHPQVASAGTLMQTHDAGFEWTNNIERVAWNWLDKVIPAPGYTPAGMIVWSPTTAAVTLFIFGSTTTYSGAQQGPQIDYLFPVIASQAHVFSVWVWVDTGTLSMTPKIAWRDQTQAIVSTSTGAPVTVTTTPQLVQFSATCPANAVFASGEMENSGASNTQHIYFTRIGWGLGTAPLDGKQPRGGPLVWTRVRFAYQNAGAQQISGFEPALFTGQREKFADFDVPVDRPLLYRASIALTNSVGLVLNSSYSTYQTLRVPTPPTTLVRSVTNPTLHVAANRRKQATFTHVEDAQVFHPLGADAGPVKVRDWAGGEDGQLILLTATEAQYQRLQQLITTSDVLIIHWAQGGRTYALITDRSTDEIMSVDADWCDVDGTSSWAKYAVHTLGFIETVAP